MHTAVNCKEPTIETRRGQDVQLRTTGEMSRLNGGKLCTDGMPNKGIIAAVREMVGQRKTRDCSEVIEAATGVSVEQLQEVVPLDGALADSKQAGKNLAFAKAKVEAWGGQRGLRGARGKSKRQQNKESVG